MARSFAGGTDGVAYASPGNLSTAWSHAFWMRTTQATTDAAPVTFIQPTAVSGYAAFINRTAGKLSLEGKNGAGTVRISLTGTATVNDGAWHQITITATGQSTGDTVAIYVDGTLDTSGTNSGAWSFTASSIPCLGDSNVAAWASYVGEVAEFGIWSKTLDAAERASLAAGFSPKVVATRSLELYAPLVRDARELVFGVSATVTGSSVSDHPRTMGGAI